MTINAQGLRVFPRLDPGSTPARRQSCNNASGIAELDTMLPGGLECGTHDLHHRSERGREKLAECHLCQSKPPPEGNAR